jgi:hypothetical protein
MAITAAIQIIGWLIGSTVLAAAQPVSPHLQFR